MWTGRQVRPSPVQELSNLAPMRRMGYPPISWRQPFAHSHHRPQKSPSWKALPSTTVYVWRTTYANICFSVMGMVMGN
jgi:hypothetical protein